VVVPATSARRRLSASAAGGRFDEYAVGEFLLIEED
jgi:hypothetical protein